MTLLFATSNFISDSLAESISEQGVYLNVEWFTGLWWEVSLKGNYNLSDLSISLEDLIWNIKLF